MKNFSTTLAFTTTALLNSSLPFAVLSLIATLSSIVALLIPVAISTLSSGLLLSALLLALPLAWVGLRLLFDIQVMHKWSTHVDEQECNEFDNSLKAIGLITATQPRELAARARGCAKLQKIFIAIVAVQWIVFIMAIIFRKL